MQNTGYDYELISTIPYDNTTPGLMAEVKAIWKNAFVEEIEKIDGEKLWLFFAKNKKMAREDNGYGTDMNGEGCFSIIASKVSLVDEVYAMINGNRKISREIRLVLPDVWYYTLVLPGIIENCHFSKKIYEMVRTVLSAGQIDKNPKIIEQKPVQFYI